jgi:hypothetical protein
MSAAEHQGSSATPSANPHGVAARRVSSLFAWLAGGEARVLALVPSERPFMQAQGVVIFLMACITGCALSIAASSWWSISIASTLALAPIWTLVICMIDRLIYKSFGTNRWANIALGVPRAVLSLMLALVLGLPMVQFIFKPSINNQLSNSIVTQENAARAAVMAFYEPKIDNATSQIKAIEEHETVLRNKANTDTRLSGCESNEPSCSHTHRPGCEQWCKYYARHAAIATASLNAAKPRDANQINYLTTRIGGWRSAEKTEIHKLVAAIDGDKDMLAREQALSAIEKKHPEVTKYVLFVLGLLICLDLTPLLGKMMHLLVTGAAYEEMAAALRATERVEAHHLLEQAAVLRNRYSTQARADEEVDQVRIDVDRERRIAEEEAKWDGRHAPRSPRQPIGGRSLSEYVSNMRAHERHPVPVPRTLRLAGWIGTLATSLIAAVLGIYTLHTGTPVSGEWIAIVSCASSISLMAFTRGFTRAPSWALRATFVAFGAGLAMPVLVLALNI